MERGGGEAKRPRIFQPEAVRFHQRRRSGVYAFFASLYQKRVQVSVIGVWFDRAVNAAKFSMYGHARSKPVAAPGHGTAGITTAISFCRSSRITLRFFSSSSLRWASTRSCIFCEG